MPLTWLDDNGETWPMTWDGEPLVWVDAEHEDSGDAGARRPTR